MSFDSLPPDSLPSIAGDIPQVVGLFKKVRRGCPMEPAPDGKMEFLVGSGIVGDENQHPMSPRQVLVTRTEDLQSFGIAPGLLKENIVLHGLAEDLFVPGAAIKFSSGVRIRLTFHCEPCKRIAHVVPNLSHLYLRRGLLGVVLQSGELRMGDSATVESGAFDPLSLFPYERFLHFVAQVPAGHVITYKDVIVGMGVADSYFRAIPGYLKRAKEGYPLHRVVDSEGFLVPYVPGQREMLAQEGVKVMADPSHFPLRKCKTVSRKTPDRLATTPDRINLAQFRWCDETVYLS